MYDFTYVYQDLMMLLVMMDDGTPESRCGSNIFLGLEHYPLSSPEVSVIYNNFN